MFRNLYLDPIGNIVDGRGSLVLNGWPWESCKSRFTSIFGNFCLAPLNLLPLLVPPIEAWSQWRGVLRAGHVIDIDQLPRPKTPHGETPTSGSGSW